MKTFKDIDQARYQGNYSGGGSTEFFNCRQLANEVFGEARMEQPCLTALAYLYRRFGPPFYGSDSYKEICSYFLTTPTEGLFLDVGVKAGACMFLWRCAYTPELDLKFPHVMSVKGDPWKYSNPIIEECRESLKASMREMLRPVAVRDILINLFGRCKDDGFDCDSCGDDGFAERSRYAGLGASVRLDVQRMVNGG